MFTVLGRRKGRARDPCSERSENAESHDGGVAENVAWLAESALADRGCLADASDVSVAIDHVAIDEAGLPAGGPPNCDDDGSAVYVVDPHGSSLKAIDN